MVLKCCYYFYLDLQKCSPFLRSIILVFCAIVVIATCQVLLVFKIKIPVEKCGNLWYFVDSPAISDVFIVFFVYIFMVT